MKKKKRILVVDDEKDVRETLESVLAKLDYDPVVASGGKEALEMIKPLLISVYYL